MNKCPNCGDSTDNPKFCTRSCAASFNNRVAPRRKRTKECKCCGELIRSNVTYCSENCRLLNRDQKSLEVWERQTLGDLKGLGNANSGGRYPYIRNLSRRKYLSSDKPKCCAVCGYGLHFDVAHIKEIKSFDLSTPISVVNDIDNLVALCKNHHWELDNGHLTLAEGCCSIH